LSRNVAHQFRENDAGNVSMTGDCVCSNVVAKFVQKNEGTSIIDIRRIGDFPLLNL
jgi:hypothetical protein